MISSKGLIILAVIAAAAIVSCNRPAHSKGLLRSMVRGAAVGVGVGAGMTAGSAAMASVLSPKEKALAEKCERTSYYKDHQKLCDELPK